MKIFPCVLSIMSCAFVFAAEPKQKVEGFASIVQSPSANSRPGAIPLDFRGPMPGHMTAPWWTRGTKDRLSWKSATVPAKQDTLFAFIASSSVIPAEFSRGPKAKLYLNGKAIVTFDIGQTRDRV